MTKVYKKNLVEGLKYLSSRDLQITAWIEENDIYSSFVDEVEAVYTDTGLEYALRQGEVVFDKVTDKALVELLEIIEALGFEHSEKELIDMPEMQVIREKAKAALDLVKASDGLESTVEIINDPSARQDEIDDAIIDLGD